MTEGGNLKDTHSHDHRRHPARRVRERRSIAVPGPCRHGQRARGHGDDRRHSSRPGDRSRERSRGYLDRGIHLRTASGGRRRRPLHR